MMPKSLKTPIEPLDDDYQAKLKALGQTAK